MRHQLKIFLYLQKNSKLILFFLFFFTYNQILLSAPRQIFTPEVPDKIKILISKKDIKKYYYNLAKIVN